MRHFTVWRKRSSSTSSSGLNQNGNGPTHKKSQAEVKVEEALGGWYWFWFGLWFDFNSNHASRTCRIVLFEQLIMRWVINYIFKLIPLVFLFSTNSFVIRFSVIVIVFFLQHYFIWFSFPFTVDKFLPAINYQVYLFLFFFLSLSFSLLRLLFILYVFIYYFCAFIYKSLVCDSKF